MRREKSIPSIPPVSVRAGARLQKRRGRPKRRLCAPCGALLCSDFCPRAFVFLLFFLDLLKTTILCLDFRGRQAVFGCSRAQRALREIQREQSGNAEGAAARADCQKKREKDRETRNALAPARDERDHPAKSAERAEKRAEKRAERGAIGRAQMRLLTLRGGF